MLGWLSAEAARASLSKRFRRSLSEDSSSGRTLIATSRPSRGSLALQTSPIPPDPSGERISYGPRRLPGAIVMAPSRPASSPFDLPFLKFHYHCSAVTVSRKQNIDGTSLAEALRPPSLLAGRGRPRAHDGAARGGQPASLGRRGDPSGGHRQADGRQRRLLPDAPGGAGDAR